MLFEFLFELVFQFLFEFLADVVFEAGFKTTARVLRSRVGRYTAGAAVGLLAGAAWGAYLESAGTAHRPRLMWVSLAVAGVALVAAAAKSSEIAPRSEKRRGPWTDAFAPWRWPPYRLVGFAVMNIALAAGIALAWDPPVLG